MAQEVKFISYAHKVKGGMDDIIIKTLHEVCGELEARVKRNTFVDTGATKNSWQYRITKSGDTYTGTVGSDYENAIWEEFGTGEYALHGNGRKGGWRYVKADGTGGFTYGKKPRRPFQRAYDALKNKLIKVIQDRLAGGMK